MGVEWDAETLMNDAGMSFGPLEETVPVTDLVALLVGLVHTRPVALLEAPLTGEHRALGASPSDRFERAASLTPPDAIPDQDDHYHQEHPRKPVQAPQ